METIFTLCTSHLKAKRTPTAISEEEGESVTFCGEEKRAMTSSRLPGDELPPDKRGKVTALLMIK